MHRSREELYDLSRDPEEVQNLADDPAYQKALAQLRADMARFRAATHDPWLPGESQAFGHSEH
jgi:N-sulfoglucosamine sulfohydrolase